MTTTPKVRGRKPLSLNQSLVPLLDGPRPIADLSISRFLVKRAVKEGIIAAAAEVVVTGKRGRPAHKFRLTDKGRKRAKRAVAHA